MFSFLIPVYNYDCRTLVRELVRQCRELHAGSGTDGFAYEVVIADDASTDTAIERANARLADEEGVRYLRVAENMGRARIRNFLARQARHEHCVIIDCDALVCTPDFVRTYYRHRDEADVIVGALRNPDTCPPGCELRYRYEQQAMHRRTVAYRASNPYAYLSTFNLMMRRTVLMRLPFDERCTDYGYEDALMGLNLRREGITILHIDNPLVHNGMDRNADYLDKTMKALRTLHRLDGPMQEFSGVARMCHKVRRLHLRPVVLALYSAIRTPVRRNLLGRHPSITLFQLFKVGEYLLLR